MINTNIDLSFEEFLPIPHLPKIQVYERRVKRGKKEKKNKVKKDIEIVRWI